MGGELGIFLLLVGTVLGAIGSALYAWRSKARLAWRVAVGIAVFAVGLSLPLSLLVATGLYVKHTSPQPVLAPAERPSK